mgnify:CR=1 FL=1
METTKLYVEYIVVGMETLAIIFSVSYTHLTLPTIA